MSGCAPRGRDLAQWDTSEHPLPLVFVARSLGFLGPTGTFTEEALRSVLACAPEAEPHERRVIPFPSLLDTVQAVSEGVVDCAVVPIENSIEGSVSATVDILAHGVENLQVVREVRLPIRHRLIAREGVSLEDITHVVSHPHANAQCRGWLRLHLPDASVEAANSTADAVERVAASAEPWAAIGTALAAREYGCVVLEESIEDHDDNETRFVFLSRTRERQDLPEPYKTSVVCRILKDQPGALLLILQEFAHRYINLTKIESRPSKRSLGDYIFLIDLEGKVGDPQVTDALRCLTCKLLEVKVLGSYPMGVPGATSDAF
ncbi:MAG TPA: prephenate dehydratase [Thermoleophilia bacterium]|nr:prephenate dehydratase [Thermoleophilia bacterium]